MADNTLPRWKDLLWPTLEAVKALGGSGTNQEIESKVADLAKLSEEQQGVPHGEGRVWQRRPGSRPALSRPPCEVVPCS